MRVAYAVLIVFNAVSCNYLDQKIDGMTLRCWKDPKCRPWHGPKLYSMLYRNVHTVLYVLVMMLFSEEAVGIWQN